MTITKLQSALNAIDSAVYGDGYLTYRIKLLTGLAEKMADYIGLEWSDFEGNEGEFSKTHCRRIRRLADKYDLTIPCHLLAAIEDREERATWYKFESTSGQVLYIDADFRHASCPIKAMYEGCDWFATPFQVADAQHIPHRACLLVARWNG